MTLPRGADELRAQVQANHIGFVQTEIDLVNTLVQMAKSQYGMRYLEGRPKSLANAQDGIDSARRGLARIDSAESWARFGSTIDALEAALHDFNC
jgi:hypothetical protein